MLVTQKCKAAKTRQALHCLEYQVMVVGATIELAALWVQL